MTTYALLVGIDRYSGDVRQLKGCQADAEAMAALLEARVPGAEVRLLLNEDATREGFEAAFRAHLGQASAGDTALLWYSGHGSRTPTSSGPDLAPDGYDETLVFVDSRTPSGRDMLDKELGTLISEIAQPGVQVVVGLDACHSGSGTREELDPETLVRRAPTGERVVSRPAGGTATEAGGWSLDGPHVLLAACRSEQTAKERPIGGVHRGVFTASVERALHSGAARTYRELLPLVRDAVSAIGVADQAPQLEAVGGASVEASVFTGAERGPGGFVVTYDSRLKQWVMDAGAVHGVPPATDGSTRIAVRPGDAALTSPPLAVVTPLQVEPQRTQLRVLTGELKPGAAYAGRISAWDSPRTEVALPEGDLALAALVGDTALLTPAPDALIRVEATPDRYDVFDGRDASTAVLRVPRDPVAALTVTSALERIARWHAIERLANPETAASSVGVTIDVLATGPLRHESEGVVVPYVDAGDRPQPQVVTLVVRNDSDRDLYCGVFALGRRYGISSALTAGVVKLPPGGESRRKFLLHLPDDAPATAARSTDVLKLISSTVEFDPSPLLQAQLGETEDRGASADRDVPRNALDGLLRAVGERELTAVDDAPHADWSATTLRLIAERPLTRVPLGNGPVLLADAVTIEAPVGLGGTARLTTSAEATRDFGAPLVPPLLLDRPGEWDAMSLAPVRDAGYALDVLDLEGVDASAVTADTPLLVRLPYALAPGEHAIVIAYDGTDYLPVGFAARAEGDPAAVGDRSAGTVIRITSIPDAIDARGIGRAAKLLFRRLWLRVTGRKDEVTRLAVATLVDPAGDSRIAYDDDRAEVRRAVREANRVLLVVHGIIGDTEGMTLGCFTSDDGNIIAAPYDVVLTFDYESINTPIDTNAEELARKLLDAGLGPGHGKTFDIVAHSMGGLVSRWMIEKLPDSPEIGRLIMAGTPNAGSPIPGTVDLATVWLAFVLNNMPELAWPLRIVGGLLSAIEKVDVALDQMDPKSQFYVQLREGADRGIPYTIVLGDRSLKPWAEDERAVGLAKKLIKGAVDFGVGGIFRGETNDIAVSERSGRDMAVAARRALEPVVFAKVACDHMTYFSLPEGRAGLHAAFAPLAPPA